jgi:hypothetical protein
MDAPLILKEGDHICPVQDGNMNTLYEENIKHHKYMTYKWFAYEHIYEETI